jgi:hypothetical protein
MSSITVVVKTINGIGIATQTLPATFSAPYQVAPHARRNAVNAAHVHVLNVYS